MPAFKKSLWIQYLTIGLLALSIGVYFRLYPLRSYQSDDATNKASLLVISQIKNQVAKKVYQQHPDIPEQQRNVLIKDEFDQFLHQNSKKIRETIDQVSRNLDAEFPQSKKRYLLESDSFYYYGLTENIVQTGKIATTIKGSKFLHEQMLAPVGHWEPLNLHPYVGFFVYRLLKIFDPNISLMYALGFTPIIITALSIIPFLALTYLMGCRPIFSFIGAVFFLLTPIFIKRSTWGWYDNDPYNILFPLLILMYICYQLRHLTNRRNTYIFGALIALHFMLYALFWHGWMFLFTSISLTAVGILLYNHFIIKETSRSKSLLIFFGIIALGSFLAISITFGPDQFFVLFSEGWTALKGFLNPQLSLWPDLYMTVGELHASSPALLLELTGGIFFYGFALIGLIIAVCNLFKKETTNQKNLFNLIIILFWILSLYLTLGAQRFAMFHFIPLALMFPIGLQGFKDILEKTLHKFFPKQRYHPFILNFLLILSLSTVLLPIRNIHLNIAKLLNPIFNDTWEKAMIEIKEKTPEDAIINSWWPPGHFIKSIAHRRVTFDGASINFPQAYWLANVFLTSDEKNAAGILRMLNDSANQASDELTRLGIKLSTATDILNTITRLDEPQARKTLEKYISDKTAIDHILILTHKTPPPSYLFVYKEFVDNNIQLPFIGHWNIKRIEEINENPELLKQIPKHTSKEYINFLWDLAGGPYKYSGPLAQLNQTGQTLFFEDGISVDLETKECHVHSRKFGGEGIPLSIFYLDEDKIVEKKLPGGNLPYSILLYPDSNRFGVILLDRELAQSLLIRLYFFEGKGVKYFQRVINVSDLTKRNVIYVFKIDWEEFLKDTKQPQ